MSGDMEILFSLAGRIHCLLRREINRIVDVEWMCADAAYAKEVIKLARTIESEELHKLARAVEECTPSCPYRAPCCPDNSAARIKIRATLR